MGFSMTTSVSVGSRLRTRWSAIGAAVAITLGAGGIGIAQATIDSGDRPATVTVDAERILDTRADLGLSGSFVKDTPRDVQVTGAVEVATSSGTATKTVVPDGATAVLVNVTVVLPTDQGFLTLRSADAVGEPSTSTVNFQAGSVEPNAATVDLSADGKLQVWVFMPDAAAEADVLIDVVGYTVDHNHDDRYYTQGQVDAAVAAAVAGKVDSADVYTKAEVDALVASKILFATINSDGTLRAGSSGLVSSARNGVGDYTLTFDRNLRQCAAATADLEFLGNRDISVEVGNDNSLRVLAADSSDAYTDAYFNIIVAC